MTEADDVEVIDPDRPLTVGGRDVVVREFRFAEGARMSHVAKPIVDDLRAIVEAQLAAGEGHEFELSTDTILDLLGKHIDAWVKLVAQSTGLDEEFVANLRETEAHPLWLTFWEVNRRFFTTRLVPSSKAPAAAAPSASETSSTS